MKKHRVPTDPNIPPTKVAAPTFITLTQNLPDYQLNPQLVGGVHSAALCPAPVQKKSSLALPATRWHGGGAVGKRSLSNGGGQAGGEGLF